MAFVQSDAWCGPKEGYVFKKDKDGVGYYPDVHGKGVGALNLAQMKAREKLSGASDDSFRYDETDLRRWCEDRLNEIFTGELLLDVGGVRLAVTKCEAYGEAFKGNRKGKVSVT